MTSGPGHIGEVQRSLIVNRMTAREGCKWLQGQNIFLSLNYFHFIGKEKDLCLYLIRIIYDQDEKNQILMTNIWLNLVSVCNQAKRSTVCLMFSFLYCV